MSSESEPTSTDSLAMLLDSVPVALLIIGSDGRIVSTNESLNGLFEYKSGELVGQPVEILVPKDVVGGHAELREAYFEVPHRRQMGNGRNLNGVTQSGRLVAVEIGLDTVDLDGEPHVIASVLDLTALRAEQEKTRLAVDASASAMIMVNADNEIVLVNEQAVDMFGHPMEAMLGHPIELLVPMEHRRRHRVYRESYVAGPTRRSMGSGRSLHGLRADGTEFPVEIGLTPIADHGQQFIMATVMDITERRQNEDEIRRQNTDLTRLNQELAQFAYSASHDLKAPLASLDGMLMCLMDDLDQGDSDAAKESATVAQDLARRLASLIEGILGFARADSVEEEITLVDLREAVESLREDLQAIFEGFGVELRVEVPSGLTLRSGRQRVVQILENLLTNGAKYHSPDRKERFVAVEARRDGTDVVVSVSDNGIGIPAEDRDQVFTMFRRFSNHGQEGTGLGLALVKQNVDRLGGQVNFTSSHHGTTFVVRLPSIDRRRSGDRPATADVPDEGETERDAPALTMGAAER